jgi:hypothetical protein
MQALQSSPTSPSAALPCPLAQATKEHISDAVASLGPAFTPYADAVIAHGIDGACIIELFASPGPDDINKFVMELGVESVLQRSKLRALLSSMHQRHEQAAAAAPLPYPLPDDSHERNLWLKACLILDVCAIGVRPFVSSVMQRLHQQVIRNAMQDVKRDLGVIEGEEWDCSACDDADDAKFTEKSPVALTICAMNCNGIADCGSPHELKPHALQRCRLKNIPDACFPDWKTDCDSLCPMLPLLLSPNPADIDRPDSSTFLLLRCSQPMPTEPHLTPFVVTRRDPSEPALQFHAVLCDSRPGHTAQLVESFLSQKPPPLVRGNLAFAFWSLALNGSKFSEQKHGVKNGHILRFDGGEENSLPPGMQPGSRYLVTAATDFSFNICGPILAPHSPLTAESYPADGAPLVVIRSSPIAR